MSSFTVSPAGRRPAAPVTGVRADLRPAAAAEDPAKPDAARFDRVEISGAARSLRTVSGLGAASERSGAAALDRLLRAGVPAMDRRMSEALDQI